MDPKLCLLLVLALTKAEDIDDDYSEEIDIKYTAEDSGNNIFGDILNLGGDNGLLSSLGGNDGLLSSLGGDNGLLSSLGNLDLGPKGLGDILEKLNPDKESGSAPLFDALKDPSLLSSLLPGKNGRKLNLPIPPEISEDIAKVLNPGSTEEGKSAARKSLNNLMKAYRAYLNIFNPSKIDDDDNELEKDDRLLISTSDGVVRGIIVDEDDVKYHSFLGIPYAETPVRFQAPKLVQPWTGIKDTRKEKSTCTQFDEFLQQTGGSEDCLYLNIHTPNVDYNNLPVIVWIHGGSFKFGSSSSVIYGPQRFLKENVIVVSISYRLGAFGFLSTGTKHAPGNAGLKDVVTALRWLQKNIHMFGGDTYNICLYGVSTGAGMVEYLTMSKMAQGLFQKAIIASGSALSSQFYVEDPLKYAFKLGKYMDYHTNNIEDLMNFLTQAKAFDIVDASEKMDKNNNPAANYFHFAPSVEEYIEGEEILLHDTPERLLKSGEFEQIPTLIGFNADEGLHLLKNVKNFTKYLDSMNDVFEFLQPPELLRCHKNSITKKAILDRIKQFYFGDQRISTNTLQSFIDMMGDIFFSNGVFKSLYLRSQHLTNAPLYLYEFAYDGPAGLSKNYLHSNLSGVAHADDVGYVFKFSILNAVFEANKKVQMVSRNMLTLYTNFLKYGNPTPFQSQVVSVTWPPISREQLPYLRVTESLELKYNPNESRNRFWAELYDSIS